MSSDGIGSSKDRSASCQIADVATTRHRNSLLLQDFQECRRVARDLIKLINAADTLEDILRYVGTTSTRLKGAISYPKPLRNC